MSKLTKLYLINPSSLNKINKQKKISKADVDVYSKWKNLERKRKLLRVIKKYLPKINRESQTEVHKTVPEHKIQQVDHEVQANYDLQDQEVQAGYDLQD